MTTNTSIPLPPFVPMRDGGDTSDDDKDTDDDVDEEEDKTVDQ